MDIASPSFVSNPNTEEEREGADDAHEDMEDDTQDDGSQRERTRASWAMTRLAVEAISGRDAVRGWWERKYVPLHRSFVVVVVDGRIFSLFFPRLRPSRSRRCRGGASKKREIHGWCRASCIVIRSSSLQHKQPRRKSNNIKVSIPCTGGGGGGTTAAAAASAVVAEEDEEEDEDTTYGGSSVSLSWWSSCAERFSIGFVWGCRLRPPLPREFFIFISSFFCRMEMDEGRASGGGGGASNRQERYKRGGGGRDDDDDDDRLGPRRRARRPSSDTSLDKGLAWPLPSRASFSFASSPPLFSSCWSPPWVFRSFFFFFFFARRRQASSTIASIASTVLYVVRSNGIPKRARRGGGGGGAGRRRPRSRISSFGSLLLLLLLFVVWSSSFSCVASRRGLRRCSSTTRTAGGKGESTGHESGKQNGRVGPMPVRHDEGEYGGSEKSAVVVVVVFIVGVGAGRRKRGTPRAVFFSVSRSSTGDGERCTSEIGVGINEYRRIASLSCASSSWG